MHTQTERKRAQPPLADCPRLAPHARHVWRETGGKRRTYTCGGAQGRAPDSSIRLRPEAFTPEALASYGWAHPTEAAQSIGVSGSTLRRAIAGEIAPGERLIAALITGTGRTFDALFHVVSTDKREPTLPTGEPEPAREPEPVSV